MLESDSNVGTQLIGESSREEESIAVPVHALILSGGRSRRMGQPKALLGYGGQTFLGHLGAVLSSSCDSVTVVTGAHHRQIETRLPPEMCLIHAPDWSLGMRASLRAGLRGMPSGAVLLTHVDRPTILPATVAHIVSSSCRSPVIPVFRHQTGHPVLIPNWLRERLLRPDQTPLREILKKAGYKRLIVGDPGVLENVNCPADYARLRAPG